MSDPGSGARPPLGPFPPGGPRRRTAPQVPDDDATGPIPAVPVPDLPTEPLPPGAEFAPGTPGAGSPAPRFGARPAGEFRRPAGVAPSAPARTETAVHAAPVTPAAPSTSVAPAVPVAPVVPAAPVTPAAPRPLGATQQLRALLLPDRPGRPVPTSPGPARPGGEPRPAGVASAVPLSPGGHPLWGGPPDTATAAPVGGPEPVAPAPPGTVPPLPPPGAAAPFPPPGAVAPFPPLPWSAPPAAEHPPRRAALLPFLAGASAVLLLATIVLTVLYTGAAGDLRRSHTDLASARRAADARAADVAARDRTIAGLRGDLATARDELAATEHELTGTRSRLGTTVDQLGNTKDLLGATQADKQVVSHCLKLILDFFDAAARGDDGRARELYSEANAPCQSADAIVNR